MQTKKYLSLQSPSASLTREGLRFADKENVLPLTSLGKFSILIKNFYLTVINTQSMYSSFGHLEFGWNTFSYTAFKKM